MMIPQHDISHSMIRLIWRNGWKTACLFFFFSIIFFNNINTAHSQAVRDAEIENLLHDYSRPLLLAAGLDPKNVNIGVINHPAFNAFVAGGQNMFFNTGLILQADDPNMVIGVIAHEIGHITGGHLARTSSAVANVQRPAMIATILGFGSILAGAGDVGLALITGSQQVAQRAFLSYSRGQEAAADGSALQLLQLTRQSPDGLIAMMDNLAGQEVLNEVNQDPYARSHPLSRHRVAAYEEGARHSPYRGKKDPPELQKRHDLVKAKIYGFLERPSVTLRHYANDNELTGRYARAIALHRQGSTNASLALIDTLIAQSPNNPYFYELKGQVACEAGRAKIGITPYKKAIALMPDEALFYVGLAGCQLEIIGTDKAFYQAAVENLRTALRLAPDTIAAYFLLAKAFGQLERVAYAEWALAEYYALLRNQQAIIHAKRALRGLPKNSVEHIYARDILATASSWPKRR
ncbi:MAG: M48 family metalloprotease [Parvibaculales bacterium]